MSRPLLLCVLLAAVTTGSSLQCMQCTDVAGKTCAGIAVNCAPTSDVCTSTLVQDEIDTSDPESMFLLDGSRNKTSYMFLRDCGNSSDCNKVVILRTPYNRMVKSTRCCRSNLCTPETPKPIPESAQNGVTCPGCLTVTQDRCEKYKPVSCRGNEQNCFSFSSKPSKGSDVSYALSGCASQSACNMELEIGNQVQCTSGSEDLYLPLLLVALTTWSHLLY
ncbi:phospholipase A2 inhibitor gamma subunit B-like [Spea bombifrons]|uniref:phospholipase A2 inhibitor gamma subunit B-like n=1 Tax=Spea bombifrons TaxID=233779 RepID=UPI00234BDB14|nr:phospholipase A2 inhibitor gamma subunit B-like [Spea bombifrons]